MPVVISPGMFRMLLALIVVLHHFSRVGLGDAAVCLFFALSGYWISIMWEAQYVRAKQKYLTFLVSRFWRLIPTFGLCSLVVFFLNPDFIPQNYISFLPNIMIIGYRYLEFLPLVPAWSLDVELQFYIVFPLIYVLYQKATKKVMITLLSGWTASSVLLLYYQGGAVMTASFPQLLTFFMIGIATARWKWKPSQATALASLGLVAAFLLLAISLPTLREMVLGGVNQTANFAYNPIFNIVLAIMAVPYAISTVYNTSTKTDRALGDLSYVVYLMHWPAFIFVHNHFGHMPALQRLPYAFLSLAVAFAVSFLIWLVWDRPINRKRHAWVRSRILTSSQLEQGAPMIVGGSVVNRQVDVPIETH